MLTIGSIYIRFPFRASPSSLRPLCDSPVVPRVDKGVSSLPSRAHCVDTAHIGWAFRRLQEVQERQVFCHPDVGGILLTGGNNPKPVVEVAEVGREAVAIRYARVVRRGVPRAAPQYPISTGGRAFGVSF